MIDLLSVRPITMKVESEKNLELIWKFCLLRDC